MSMNDGFQLKEIITLDGFVGRAKFTIEEWGVTAEFEGGEDSYIASYRLPEAYQSAGVSARLRLRDWSAIKYLAIGYTTPNGYCHIKSMNIRKESWFNIGFRHDDIVYQLQNGVASNETSEISDIKIFVKGTPRGTGSFLDIADLACSVSVLPNASITATAPEKVDANVYQLIVSYLKKSFRDYREQAEAFLSTGNCPVPGKRQLAWSAEDALPAEVETVNTYRFSWHAQHPAIQLLLLAEDTKDHAPVFSARSLIEQWLIRSFYQADKDIKFAWYDHGTAERLLAFILMWQKAVEYKMDARFMQQLSSAIEKHAELLASEAFYAYNQPDRYHNHAWFQDAALISAALSFPKFASASYWLNTAVDRFDDQLATLIVRDGGYAIFVENSIGYHHGVQRLAELAGNLVLLSGLDSEIPNIAQELVAWSEFLRYPDGRVPAQGDTFRLPPRTGNDIRRGKPCGSPSCTVLPKAGYAVVKGNHDNKPWMLCLFNTSLSPTHKHEDNLSITFWFDGIEWLIDPSFYSHEYDQEIPRYLRSAGAHNTISVDDIAFDVGMADAQLKNNRPDSNTEFSFEASHKSFNGYELKRQIYGSLNSIDLDVQDIFNANGTSSNSLSFTVGENIKASIKGQSIILESQDSEFNISISIGDAKLEINDKPIGLGFMSSVNSSSFKIKPDHSRNKNISWKLTSKLKQTATSNQQPATSNRKLVSGFHSLSSTENIGRILLIGSCVTRDALTYLHNDSIDYYARSSFISLSSPPIEGMNLAQIDSIGNFEKRMILSDFDKRLINQLTPGKYDAVILDFIDERFDLVMINDRYVTHSNYLIKSEVLNQFPDHKICNRFTLNDKWSEACEHIVRKIKSLGIPVILHKAWWAERFYNHSTGVIEEFDNEQLKIVRKYNALLSNYYDTICKLYPEIKIVEADSDLVYSDFAHKWGKDYFHYSELYYKDLAEKIARTLFH